MTFSVVYKKLFKIELLHNYFLNQGTKKFVEMSDSEKSKQLADYNINNIMSVFPSQETAGLLKGHNLLYKITNNGFYILSKANSDDNRKPMTGLDGDLYLTFLMKIKDPLFYNYTELKLDKAGILIYISNRKPDTETDSFPKLRNSNEVLNINESLNPSDRGIDKIREEMRNEDLSNLFGIIRIFIKGDTGTQNILDSQGRFADTVPFFRLLFKNRSTTWRYIFSKEQQVSIVDNVKIEDGDSKRLVTKNSYPLTSKGFISLKLNGMELPNPGVYLIKPDLSTNTIYSEIFM
jgi:hypothetical protein